jgi:hypothetical protein
MSRGDWRAHGRCCLAGWVVAGRSLGQLRVDVEVRKRPVNRIRCQ